jgi:flagellar capping protein FliD
VVIFLSQEITAQALSETTKRKFTVGVNLYTTWWQTDFVNPAVKPRTIHQGVDVFFMYNLAFKPNSLNAFSIGLEGGEIVPIAYDAGTHSLEDIRDMINEAEVGVTAGIEKMVDEEANVVYYRLSLESDIPGRAAGPGCRRPGRHPGARRHPRAHGDG